MMSSGEVRKVQNLIERCLQLYMNQKEVVDTLSLQANIEPSFTELVWQKLEEENQEFFKAYHVRLILKNQIVVFNKLLEKQVELMRKACPPGVAVLPFSNGSNSLAYHQNPSCYLSQHASTSSRPDSMPYNEEFSNPLVNARTSGQPGSDPSILSGSMNASKNVFSSHRDSIGRIPGMGGMTVKSEPIYSNDEFPFDILENYARSPYIPPDSNDFSSSPPSREFKEEDPKRLDTKSEGVSYEDFGSG